MAIRFKVARTAKELDDVFKLRYEIFVDEKRKFAPETKEIEETCRIVDRFDCIPDVANIIAYENDAAVACLRVNKDSEIGLPAEMHFKFSHSRAQLKQQSRFNNAQEIVMVSGGMLAIKKKWRNRRNVIYALFKIAFGIMHCWGATHVIASISKDSLSLYGRIGFSPVAEAEWKESVGDFLVPMLAPFDKVFQWAFGNVDAKIKPFWSNNYCGRFERLLLSMGEVLFYQDDLAEHAYAIDDGWISISRTDQKGNEMVLSNLSKGALFGELAIFDNEPRSATATAITNVELVVIHRDNLLAMVKENPEQMGQILHHLSNRIREIDESVMVRAFAPQTARIYFALKKLWASTAPNKKNSKVKTVKVGVTQIARSAHVQEDEVLRILKKEKAKGNLEYGKSMVRFFKQPTTNKKLMKDKRESSI